MKWLTDTWYQSHPIKWLLLPLAVLYCIIIWLRHKAYRFGIFKQHRISVPVIVVGNITVGGTGKTPLVIWLATHFKQAGFRPGIISRGYGGNSNHYPQCVNADSDPQIVGDEPIVIVRRTGLPLMVDPNRVQAANALVERHNCNIIIADDGLQHYALARDIELVVIDGIRRFGNKLCLPAGPLREPLSRLKSVDFMVNNGDGQSNEFEMQLELNSAVNLVDPGKSCSLAELSGTTVHAIAGIGNPERFFSQLETFGLAIKRHPFPDHYYYTAADLKFNDQQPIIMTEKDAVKCHSFATDNMWFVPAEAVITDTLFEQLQQRLKGTPDHG